MKSGELCMLVLFLGVFGVNANEVPKEIRGLVDGVREKCHRETGIDIEHVEKTKEGYFHPDELLGCYFSCTFNAFDLLDHEGHMDFDKVLKKLASAEPALQEHGNEMVTACRGITGTNPCDSAYKITQCFQKTNPEKYFVI